MSRKYKHPKFTATIDMEMVLDLANNNPNGAHGYTMNEYAASMLYNLIMAYSDPNIDDGWVRISSEAFKKKTGFSRKTMSKASGILMRHGYIDRKIGSRSEEEKEKFGDGGMYRPHKPSFSAEAEVE